MQTNALPFTDTRENSTGCCPRFKPAPWDGQELHFKDKPFVRAETRSAMHVPLNMGRVFSRVFDGIAPDGNFDPDNLIVLSRELSAWKAEHLFASDTPVQTEEMVTLTGDFITKVFEGPYRKAGQWYKDMQDLVRARGGTPSDIYFY